MKQKEYYCLSCKQQRDMKHPYYDCCMICKSTKIMKNKFYAYSSNDNYAENAY